MLTERCSETFMKGLIGKTEIEDALKRLDKLTQEEARMVTAQNLKVTHGVADAVVAVAQRIADEVKRLSSPNLISASHPFFHFQGYHYKRFANGSPLRTPRRTTTSHVALVTRKRQRGFFKAASFRSGSQQDRFFGFTENVRHILLSA